MRKAKFFIKWHFVALLFAITASSCTSEKEISKKKSNREYIYRGSGNPYLPLWEHLPDGEPRVFEDPDNSGKYRIYIVGSHDVTAEGYCGMDTRIWSAPLEDLSEWRDEGSVFSYEVDGQFDVFYAPDLVELIRKDGTKEYFLYPHSRGHGRIPMVAKSNRPDGPFEVINITEDGKKALPGSIMGFDPAVYIEYVTDKNDPDYEIGFRAYGYWGFKHSQAGQLDQNTMYSLRPGNEMIDYFIPAGKSYGEINDPVGIEYPNVYPDQDLGAFNFFEAASIRKIGNKYVWIYSGYSGPDYGLDSSNSTLRYAYGDSPLGPWKSGGVLVDSRAPVLSENGDAIVSSYSGHNTHGSLELINEQWYVFYHRAPRSFGYARQAMVAPVTVLWDDDLVAEGGHVHISAFDPYTDDNTWAVKAINGSVYKGAEVTSEGFHIYGLDPYQYYSAGYACYLSNTGSQQDSWDIWDNNMSITEVKNADVIGYKYFGFGGLDNDVKGLKAFEGTKEGNNTAFNLFLMPKTEHDFKVNVWLNGPWDNEIWNGKRIGEIIVPAKSANKITKFTVDVSDMVDGLNKKHAIFLTVEGNGSEALCDLIGLGFSSRQKEIIRPEAPEVSIVVNGQNIDLPDTPVRATNENGIVGYDLYETSYKVAINAESPKVAATTNNKQVKIEIKQAESVPGTAVLKCDYKGVVKTYRVVFNVK